MRKEFTSILAALLLTLLPTTTNAQTSLTARIGTDTATYHYVEVTHQYSNNLITGIGYADANDPKAARDVWSGIGRAFTTKRVNLIAIAWVDSATGTDADGTVSVQPWLLATTTVGPIIGTANYILNKPVRTASGADGETTQTLEHAKAEVDLGPVLAGIGYAGTKTGDGEWQSKPFVTTTYQSPLGDFEVWLQRPASGLSTLQLRYSRTF